MDNFENVTLHTVRPERGKIGNLPSNTHNNVYIWVYISFTLNGSIVTEYLACVFLIGVRNIYVGKMQTSLKSFQISKRIKV